MKVELYDVCRVDAASRTALGQLFPFNDVAGFDVDESAIVNNPGAGNKISYSFLPSINVTSIYTDNGDDTATVAFCAQVCVVSELLVKTILHVSDLTWFCFLLLL